MDQLERNKELDNTAVKMARQSLANAEAANPKVRKKILTELADKMDGMASDNEKVKMLAESVRGLASNQ